MQVDTNVQKSGVWKIYRSSILRLIKKQTLCCLNLFGSLFVVTGITNILSIYSFTSVVYSTDHRPLQRPQVPQSIAPARTHAPLVT